jgi:anti-sigma regulatory factor (Ser/Thr protein kinase)
MAEDEAVAVGSGRRPRVMRGSSVSIEFAYADLSAVRRLVEAHALTAGLAESQRRDAVLAVDEIASNAVRHGGGGGRLDLWRSPGWLWFRVVDSGEGLPDGVGPSLPGPAQPNGRGLWIAKRLADQLTVDSGPDGTTVTGGFAAGA